MLSIIARNGREIISGFAKNRARADSEHDAENARQRLREAADERLLSREGCESKGVNRFAKLKIGAEVGWRWKKSRGYPESGNNE